MGRTCSTYGAIHKCIQSLVGKHEGKISLGRQRCRWENIIKVDLREVGSVPGYWINLAEDRDQWRAYLTAVMTSWVL